MVPPLAGVRCKVLWGVWGDGVGCFKEKEELKYKADSVPWYNDRLYRGVDTCMDALFAGEDCTPRADRYVSAQNDVRGAADAKDLRKKLKTMSLLVKTAKEKEQLFGVYPGPCPTTHATRPSGQLARLTILWVMYGFVC